MNWGRWKEDEAVHCVMPSESLKSDITERLTLLCNLKTTKMLAMKQGRKKSKGTFQEMIQNDCVELSQPEQCS